MLPMSDIRDVAQAHINALEVDGIHGWRFLIGQESLWMEEISKILHDEFSQYGYRPPTKVFGYCPLKFISFFDA